MQMSGLARTLGGSDARTQGGSVAEQLACAGLRHRRVQIQIVAATLSGNSLRQTVHTHRASVHKHHTIVQGL